MKAKDLLVPVIGVALMATGAAAQDVTLGEQEYLDSCAVCHGADGKGDGVLAGYLTTAVPDLTRLQTANGGVFPVRYVFEVISNSVEVGAHGTTDMPAWGTRYKYRADRALGEFASLADREAFVQARILALVEHIASLQEE